MKKIDLSFISTTAGLPVKSGVLAHLQESYQEMMAGLARLMIGPEYDATKIYILRGCLNTGSGLTYVISDGVVFYAGEVYLVDAASFVSPGGQLAVGKLVVTFATGATGDPIQFTDGSSHSVLQIRKIAISSDVTGAGVTGNSNSDFANWLPVNRVKTDKRITSAFGASQTLSFRQDQSLFYTTGIPSGSGTINWDFNGAIPGTVIRLKLAMAAGTSFTVSTPAGSAIIAESGAFTQNKTNYAYFLYAGLNEGGNHEVSYNVVSI
jgi:hypothetical protein